MSAGVTLAQSYPSKPITMIIPWPAGGSSDLTLRAMGESASKHLGQPFIYDNKPGRIRDARTGDDGRGR